MKNRSNPKTAPCSRTVWSFLSCGATILAALPLSAAEVTFTGTGSASFIEPSNWSTGALPSADDIAVFSQTPGDLFVNLIDTGLEVGGLRFTNTGATTLQRGGISGSIDFRIGAGGILVEPGAGPVTIGPDIGNPENQRVKPVLLTDQSWINNSASLLTKPSGGGAIEIPNVILTIGGTGDTLILSAIVDDTVTAGVGQIVKEGTGTLYLTRAMLRVSGGVTLNEGTLSIGNNTSLGGDPPGAGWVTINGGRMIAGQSNTGASSDREVANRFIFAGDFIVGGEYDLSIVSTETYPDPVILADSCAITVTGTKTLLEEDEPVGTRPILFTIGRGIDDEGAGRGLTKLGEATLVLGGANTYTGATMVAEGVLVVAGDQSAASGAVTVAPGATLAGTGVIGGDVTVEGAVSPVDPLPGSLTVAGSVAMAAGSRAVFEIAYAAEEPFGEQASRLHVAGTLDLAAGAVVEVVAPAYTGAPGDSVLLAEAAAITGDPAGVILELVLPAELTGRLRAESGQLYLDIRDIADMESFWSGYPDYQGFKETEAAGWLHDAHFPWIYSARAAAWMYASHIGGSAQAFYGWSAAHQGWLRMDARYGGWYWNYSDEEWQF
jgi:autotransporter-associated beta strand protein